MQPPTPSQDEGLRYFVDRVRADFAQTVREVRLLVDRPPPTDETHPDFSLLVRVALTADGAHQVDHALDNVACEVSLLHEVLLDLHFSHEGEPRDEVAWSEPISRGLYP